MKDRKKHHTLNIQQGIDPPSDTNRESIQQFRAKKQGLLSADSYVEGIVSGNRTILGKAITLIESSLPSHMELSREIVERCLPHAGKSIRIGITGVPGVGKSTFIESLGTVLTGMKHKLAVLAIDPSSERSGGSILGDKTRMEKLSTDPMAFIRPSPSAGTLGGVARKTRETIILCEAAGYDIIFVETIGVGQSETAVHSMVDFFLLLMLAGAGDELQGIKRGIMEMADAIVITKADGNNMTKAETAKADYERALHLFPPKESEWVPPVLTCSALNSQGISDIWDAVTGYRDKTRSNGYFIHKRKGQARYWMHETIHQHLRDNFYLDDSIQKMLPVLEKKVLAGEFSPFHSARLLLEKYFNSERSADDKPVEPAG
jgi:LAO/AO transport system kinase